MKIIPNCLSEQLLINLEQEIISKHQDNCWRPSLPTWNKILLKGIHGECLSAFVNQENKKQIETELTNVIPFFNELNIQIYLWQPFSGIAPHNDANKKFGATIYLTNTEISDGGLFAWLPNEKKDIFSLIVPKRNLMVVNDMQEPHFVTPIAPTKMNTRYTIQIWGT